MTPRCGGARRGLAPPPSPLGPPCPPEELPLCDPGAAGRGEGVWRDGGWVCVCLGVDLCDAQPRLAKGCARGPCPGPDQGERFTP